MSKVVWLRCSSRFTKANVSSLRPLSDADCCVRLCGRNRSVPGVGLIATALPEEQDVALLSSSHVQCSHCRSFWGFIVLEIPRIWTYRSIVTGPCKNALTVRFSLRPVCRHSLSTGPIDHSFTWSYPHKLHRTLLREF